MSRKNFYGEDLHDQNFEKHDLVGADFSNADCRDTRFKGANLSNAIFMGAKLHGADFSNANLREVNFTKASVKEASNSNRFSPFSINFSGAQIQGADFTKATLDNANFSNTKSGLNNFYSLFVAIISFCICVVSSFSSTIVATFAFYYFGQRNSYKEPSLMVFLLTWFFSVVFIIFLRTFVIPILFGSEAIKIHMIVGMCLIAITIALVAGRILLGGKTNFQDNALSDIKYILIIALIFLISLGISLYPGNFKETEIFILSKFPDLGNTVKGLGKTTDGKWVAGIIGAVVGGGLGCGFSYLAIKQDNGFSWLWRMYVKFAAFGGTIFSETYLTDANFSEASLKGAKFESKHSNLEKTFCKKTRWHKTKDFRYANIGGDGYLTIPKVQELVINQDLRLHNHPDDLIFDSLYLEGINLEGAILSTESSQSRTSFVGTNFANANLRDVDLKRANLIDVNFCGTDLTRAKLTGAVIKNWKINSETKLDDIECDFIFISDAPDENGIIQRVPHGNQKFKSGEFKSYIIDDMGTLQLFIPDDGNRQALAAAFLELIRDQGITLANFQGIEKSGSNVKVKIRVPENTNQGIIEQDFARRSQSSATISEAQNSQIDPDLQEITKNLDISQTQSLFDFVLKLIELIGEKMDRRISINGDGSYIELINGNYIIHGNYINTSQDLTQAAAQIQELLQQLQQKQPTITEEEATNKVAEDLANQARSNGTMREKLRNWGASLASETANELIVSSVIRIACSIAGIPL